MGLDDRNLVKLSSSIDDKEVRINLDEGSESTFQKITITSQFFPCANPKAHTTNKLLIVRMRAHCRSGNDIRMETKDAKQHRIPTLAGVPLITAGPQRDRSF